MKKECTFRCSAATCTYEQSIYASASAVSVSVCVFVQFSIWNVLTLCCGYMLHLYIIRDRHEKSARARPSSRFEHGLVHSEALFKRAYNLHSFTSANNKIKYIFNAPHTTNNIELNREHRRCTYGNVYTPFPHIAHSSHSFICKYLCAENGPHRPNARVYYFAFAPAALYTSLMPVS